MASIWSPATRHILQVARSPLRSTQRRWAQVHDVRFLATHRDPNSILEKYKDKLERKAKEEGHGSISSLKEAYKDKIENAKRSVSIPTPLSPEATTASVSSESPVEKPPATGATQQPKAHQKNATTQTTPGIKPLSSYLDLSKVSSLPNKELEVIWRLRFASDPDSLCAVIPLETYKRIAKTAQSHPQFILPLPREIPENEGNISDSQIAADIHFLQWNFHPPSASAPQHALPPGQASANTHISTVLFTHLASYKLHGSYAPPHTTLTHHLDLADSHGVVLLHGTVMKDKGISAEEGKWLVMQLQRFYDFEGMGKGRRRELVEGFTKGEVKEKGQEGSGFNVEDLVEEAERLS